MKPSGPKSKLSGDMLKAIACSLVVLCLLVLLLCWLRPWSRSEKEKQSESPAAAEIATPLSGKGEVGSPSPAGNEAVNQEGTAPSPKPQEVEDGKSGKGEKVKGTGARPEENKPEASLVSSPQDPFGTSGAVPSAGQRFSNSLGMTFIPVSGTNVLWCEHETRVNDYEVYAAENPGIDMQWKDYEHQGHKQTGNHPVIMVSWEDAKAFCAWLSQKEGLAYRLPTDLEWSMAVGIGQIEDPGVGPEMKDGKIPGYPWGSGWPPPEGYGNFPGSEADIPSFGKIEGYRDLHPFTAPVKSYRSTNGLFDFSGNAREWCEDWYSVGVRVMRGGSWSDGEKAGLRSSGREGVPPMLRSDHYGFRCVVVPAK